MSVDTRDPEAAAGLGGRLELFDPDELTADQRRLYDHMQATWIPWAEKAGFQAQLSDGRMVGPFNLLLLNPPLSAAFLALQEAEQKSSTLDKRTREVVILTVGAVWNSDYECYAHKAVAQGAGLSAAAAAGLAAGETPDELSPAELMAQAVARELAQSRTISADLYQEAAQVFDPRALSDLIMLAGIYGLVSGLLNGFAIPAPRNR